MGGNGFQLSSLVVKKCGRPVSKPVGRFFYGRVFFNKPAGGRYGHLKALLS
jgi:hypothetical protein